MAAAQLTALQVRKDSPDGLVSSETHLRVRFGALEVRETRHSSPAL